MGQRQIDGIMNIDKPYAITSMDVVRRLKRASGQKRVGHGGTLDPVATGVVPVCFGQATRMMEHLINGSKEYRAVVEFGVTTDTYDSMGQVVETKDPSPLTLEQIGAALEPFKGVVQQVPPMYSALKRQGKRLYDLARAGIEVEREPRSVEVQDVKIIDWSPPHLTIEVACGRGFYMRSLAHDLGQSLGCGGHLKSLVRLKGGSFKLSDALALSEAEERFADGTWRDFMHTPDVALQKMAAIIVGKRGEDMIRNGRPLLGVRVPQANAEKSCRAYSVDGRFLAIIAYDAQAQQWRPDKVFALDYREAETAYQNV